jgi:hypothetical protein
VSDGAALADVDVALARLCVMDFLCCLIAFSLEDGSTRSQSEQ